MTKKPTYKMRALDYMEKHEWITPMDAIYGWGDTKLATTIGTLIRKDGYEIEKEWTKDENGKRHKRYRLYAE